MCDVNMRAGSGGQECVRACPPSWRGTGLCGRNDSSVPVQSGVMLSVSEKNVQSVERVQDLQGVGLHPPGYTGNSHRAWQGHPVTSLKPPVQILNPTFGKRPSPAFVSLPPG